MRNLLREAEHTKKKPKAHKCPRNYTDSSKVMEAGTALEAYSELYRVSNGTNTLGYIIADGESSMRSLLRHLRHRSNNHPKGVLPPDLPESEWLADPTNCTKKWRSPSLLW